TSLLPSYQPHSLTHLHICIFELVCRQSSSAGGHFLQPLHLRVLKNSSSNMHLSLYSFLADHPPMQLTQEEDFVKGDSTPTTEALQSDGSAGSPAKMCSECYVNQTFVHDDGTVNDHKPRSSSGVILDIAALNMEQQESEEVPPLPPRFRFRDLLLGDQSFQNDDR
ncbi:hypothetical protein JOQ06_008013, partial [Pogonophryne albipinna]